MQKPALIFVLLFLFAAPFSLSAQSISPRNYTVAEANLTISNATAYVNMINESSYLVFTPNLKQAYSYLGEADFLLNRSPGSAVLYADSAVASAHNAYGNMEAYREISAVGALVFTIILGLILYRFMMPIKGTKIRR